MAKREVSFWDGERCEYCNGRIRDKRTTMTRKRGDKYIFIEDVPTGVCSDCGTRYYAANVLKSIDEALKGRRKAKRKISVPVYSFRS